jgi:DNA-binding LacI/PurR family transcriptional regulator
MSHVTIEDVASRAGVSVTTVSHVFSGNRPVSESTRSRVLAIAESMGYRPNAIAASLRTNRTRTVMIVLPDITNSFFPVLARGVQDALRPHGYHALICNTDFLESEERAFLEEAVARRLDGVVFGGSWVPPSDLQRLADAGLAVVNLGEPAADTTIDSVRLDDRRAAAEATAYLFGKHAEVGYIGGPTESPVARARLLGYQDAVLASGREPNPHYVVVSEFTRAGGRSGLATMLDLPDPPGAVLCANDVIALGAIDLTESRGVSVPGDLAIMGCDDIEAAAIVRPGLTTVRNRADVIGAEAGRLLMTRINGEYSGAGRDVVVPHELVIRESA